MTRPRPAAVLWDMDGTLVDTEPDWLAAEAALVVEYGGEWSREDSLSLVGQGLWHTARVLQGRGVALDEREIIERLTTRVLERVSTGLPWRPGARELLVALREQGIPTALVTMSIGRMARHVAASTGFDAFDVVIAGDEVIHPKPHPEPYERAVAALGVDVEGCVALEDSPPGLASAVAAGVAAIGVPHILPLEEGPGVTVWPTLEHRTIDDLAEVLAARTPRVGR